MGAASETPLHYRPPARSWVEWLEDWMAAKWNATHDLLAKQPPGRVRVTNGAVPGTLSSYMSVCCGAHVPQVSLDGDCVGLQPWASFTLLLLFTTDTPPKTKV